MELEPDGSDSCFGQGEIRPQKKGVISQFFMGMGSGLGIPNSQEPFDAGPCIPSDIPQWVHHGKQSVG